MTNNYFRQEGGSRVTKINVSVSYLALFLFSTSLSIATSNLVVERMILRWSMLA